ncbi:MAG TPA: ATP phosphoribosyltransferase regulatory subunit [Firmicutes bacterium]|nr:ATP phosphoribosyltransferase regulatory subunit [Bacillota bacterium]
MVAMKNPGAAVPGGLRYLGPREAFQKRCIEERLVQVFVQWGFSEIVTPTIEYFDVISAGMGERLRDRMYRFLDRTGQIIVLRPDITTPIAHFAATELRDEPRPLRLFYLGSVFRAGSPQTGMRQESYQAGAEVIGAAGNAADAEVIALAIQCLKATGLQGFRVGIGHAGIIHYIAEQVGLDPRQEDLVRDALARHDFVALREVAGSLDLPSRKLEWLLTIPALHGKGEILKAALAPPLSPPGGQVTARGDGGGIEVLHSLGTILENLESRGLGDFVDIDLGLVRDLDYYTGIIFEAYAYGVGRPVCGGGRYDRLLESFGAGEPATGFAIDIEGLGAALAASAASHAAPSAQGLEAQGRERAGHGFELRGPDYFVIPQSEAASIEAARVAAGLRDAGHSVELEIVSRGIEDSIDYGMRRKAGSIIIVDESGNTREVKAE